MNTRTKNVILTIIFISIIIIFIMYYVVNKMETIRQCNLIIKICSEGYYNGTFDIGTDLLKQDCFIELPKCGVT